MKHTRPSNHRILIAAALCVSAALPAIAQNNDPNPIGMFMTRNHQPEYSPGSEIEIQVSFQASNNTRVINAIGLRENIPPGWTFTGLRGVTGQPPAVSPSGGTQGLLEFAWIDTPTLPYSFVYSLGIPGNDPGGTQVVTGQPEYRLAGGAKFADPVISTLIGRDNQPPVIRLTGGNNVTIAFNEPWVDPGATATDNVDGDITSRIQSNGAVNPARAGTYAITYTVSDNAGNQASERRTVRVLADGETPPPEETDGGGTGNSGNGSTDTPTGNNSGGLSNFGGGGGGDGMFDRNRNRNDRDDNKTNQARQRQQQQQRQQNARNNNNNNGSRQLRPGVIQRGNDPRSGVVIPKGPEAADPGGSAPGPGARPVSATTVSARSGDTSSSAATRPGSDAPGERQLSDEWPELEDGQVAAVTDFESAQDLGDPPPGGALAGSRSPVLPIVAAAAVCGGGLVLIFFVSRKMVYSGQRRRKPLNKD